MILNKIVDLDRISIEDNISFFSENMKMLESCDEQQKEIILSLIYVPIYKDKSNGEM